MELLKLDTNARGWFRENWGKKTWVFKKVKAHGPKPVWPFTILQMLGAANGRDLVWRSENICLLSWASTCLIIHWALDVQPVCTCKNSSHFLLGVLMLIFNYPKITLKAWIICLNREHYNYDLQSTLIFNPFVSFVCKKHFSSQLCCNQTIQI